MSRVIYLENAKGSHYLRELADQLDCGDVTHLVAAFRDKDTEIHVRLLGSEDLTYLIGLASLLKAHLERLRLDG